MMRKKKLGKNYEGKMTLYNNLPCKEYERVFMCKTAKGICHTLIITHQGSSQVKDYKIDLLTQQYEKFLIFTEETIDSGFTRAKVTTIRKAKDLATLPLDELIGNIKVSEMVLEDDGALLKKRVIDSGVEIDLVMMLIDLEEVMVMEIEAPKAQDKSAVIIIIGKKVILLVSVQSLRKIRRLSVELGVIVKKAPEAQEVHAKSSISNNDLNINELQKGNEEHLMFKNDFTKT
ncbi:hypothetical protein Tco_0937521 [Tanacetum coccineum]|uniref:Uncharacterized protein n=1 Tax=Tanacetum coccineum TaxID=301880 RepID=A0ABQ5DEH2_9ASTR